MTIEESAALYRLARSPDGRTLLSWLQRVQNRLQDTELSLSGAQSERWKGRILEIRALMQEISDADQPARQSHVNEQKRFS